MANVWDEYPELFHYTSLDAFKNIWREQKLRATGFQYLNDRSELKILNDMIRLDVERTFNRLITPPEQAPAFTTTFLEILHEIAFQDDWHRGVFITSFAGHTDPYLAVNGLLSQWRGYGMDGGVALVFDSRGLDQALRRETEQFDFALGRTGSVIYTLDGAEAAIRDEYNKMFAELPTVVENYVAKKTALTDVFLNQFIEASVRIKHRAFFEEHEVRIVLLPRSKKGQEIEERYDKKIKHVLWRPTLGGEAQYIELFGQAKLPIKRIIVGPSRHQESNVQEVRNTISPELRDLIRVEPSQIPYLG